MSWKIIKEHKRNYADKSYYFKAERTIPEGILILEIKWIENFMYNLEVNLYSKNSGLVSIFKKVNEQHIYSHLISYTDRVEKYGHQILRITKDSPITKFKRMNDLQVDSVLNWNLYDKRGVEIRTSLSEPKNN